MAENTLYAILKINTKTISAWESDTRVLRYGEPAIAEIPSGTSGSGMSPPAFALKIGDGKNQFKNLKWIQSIAGDVPAWAKTPNLKDALLTGFTKTSDSGEIVATDSMAKALSKLENNIAGKANTSHKHSYNDLTDKPSIPSAVTVDSQLDTNSTNPVQNKVINSALGGKSDKGHKHTQSEITDFPTSMPASDVESWAKQANKPTYNATEVGAIPASAKGTKNGVAELDANGRVPIAQLPSYVDDVVEGYLSSGIFYNEVEHITQITGETGKIYVDIPTNVTYRWSGSGYTEISKSLALGETSSTAYYGDKGKTAYDHSQKAHAPSDAERNVIVGIQTNGTDVTADTSRKVNIKVPTKTSDLVNDSNFKTTDNNTTYDLAANTSAVNGGVKINLTGSDKTTDSVTIKGAGATNVTTDSDGVITVTSTDTKTDTNTKYDLSAATESGDVKIKLTGNDNTTDTLTLKGSGATKVAADSSGNITISSTDTNTDTNTKYDLAATKSSANESVKINLTGNDSTTDSVTIKGSGSTVVTTDSSGVIDVHTETSGSAETVPWSGVTGKPNTYPPDTHTHKPADVGLGNVPNVTTNNQTPTFTEATSRANITGSGETLSIILGKIKRFFTDLKTVAFTGSYSDLLNKPTIPTVPQSLKNPFALTVKQNGANAKTYDGSAAAEVDITPSGIGALPVTGGAVTGVTTFENGTMVNYNMPGHRGVMGIVHIVTFKILDFAMHKPIIIEVTSRGRIESSVLSIQFEKSGGRDPGLQSFTYTGVDCDCYMHKSDTSTWDLYVSKSEQADEISVLEYKNPFFQYYTVTWDGKTQVDSVPDGAIKAVLGGKVKTAETIDGLTATVAELNYTDGVKSNIQTQLDGKAATHNHPYAGSASQGGSANSAVKLETSAGSLTQPVYFKDGKPAATTYQLNATVPKDAKFTDTTYGAAGASLGLVKSGGDATISNGVITVPGTYANPIRVTTTELDKTWKPGIYICYCDPSDSSDYRDCIVEVINWSDMDDMLVLTQKIIASSASCGNIQTAVTYIREAYTAKASNYPDILNYTVYNDWEPVNESWVDSMARTRSSTIVVSAAGSALNSRRAADYKCDGSADQTDIQTAINALPASGGKVVLLEGTYNISGSININKANVTIEGMGKGTVLTRAADNFTLLSINADNVTVRDLSISGKRTVYTSGNNYGISGTRNHNNALIQNVTFDACAWGFRISQNNNIIINGCRFVKCTGAVYFDYVFTSAVVDNFVEDCDQGIYIDWGSSKNIVEGNVLQISDGASGDKGIFLTVNGDKAKYNIVASNSVFDYNYGIDIGGNYNKIIGNYVMRGSGQSSDYTASQYTIISGGTYNDISDNYIPGKNYTNSGGSTNIFDNNRYQ